MPFFLDVHAAAAAVNLSKTTVQELIRQDQFPKPRKLSANRVGWLTREIEEWADGAAGVRSAASAEYGLAEGLIDKGGRGMSESMFLRAEELRELTQRRQSRSQSEMLRALGIEHKVRPDGSLIVLRAHVVKLLGGDGREAAADELHRIVAQRLVATEHAPMTEQAQRRILRLPEVRRMVGLSRSSIYAKIRAGDFPRPIKAGMCSLWIESEVQGWIDAQIAASRSAA
jgi:prophage regulatory protein